MKVVKEKSGSLRITITCDRNFNELKKEVEESENEIDYSLLAAAYAEEFLRQSEKVEAYNS